MVGYQVNLSNQKQFSKIADALTDAGVINVELYGNLYIPGVTPDYDRDGVLMKNVLIVFADRNGVYRRVIERAGLCTVVA